MNSKVAAVAAEHPAANIALGVELPLRDGDEGIGERPLGDEGQALELGIFGSGADGGRRRHYHRPRRQPVLAEVEQLDPRPPFEADRDLSIEHAGPHQRQRLGIAAALVGGPLAGAVEEWAINGSAKPARLSLS